MTPIRIGNFEYTKDERNQWIYKSIDTVPLKKKENPKYKELPPFPLNTTIENASIQMAGETINKTAIDIVKFIKQNLK